MSRSKDQQSTSNAIWRHDNQIVDSDDDADRDNNNEAASPDRHRNYEQCDSDETVRRDISDGSDDDVVVLETSDDETVKLSKIKSHCKLPLRSRSPDLMTVRSF